MRKVLTLAAAMVIAASAAQAAGVKVDYDTEFDFSGYETIAWQSTDPVLPNPLADQRVRRALEEGFKAKGYELVEADEADFLITFRGAVHRELRIDETLGPRWRRGVRVDSYPVGTLIVDVIDREENRLVWRGAVSDAVASDPEKAEARIGKAVTRLLKKFPPPEK